jgi:hypothetical protein
MTIDQISVFVENTPGGLADVTETLGDAGVDLRALSIADGTDFGILRIVVGETDKAVEALKAAGYVASVNAVLAVKLEDSPGSLAKVVRVLADEGVSVEYLYAFITRNAGDAYVVLRIEDEASAVKIFGEHGIATVSKEQIFEI